jgi:hypothetical protein
MKSGKVLTILVLALGLMVGPAKVASGTPLGTAFAYQGRLMDANHPAEGIYDLSFVLCDSPVGPNEIDARAVENCQIANGFFTVELDFPADLFDGTAYWLQIGVRPGELDGPNVYTVLGPRQRIAPTPYALYALSC